MRIVIYTGPAWETWGPRSVLEGGIGGSETAAVHVARQLVMLGHEVSVVGQVVPGSDEVSPGKAVEYADLRTYDRPGLIECDAFVSSRIPQAIRVLRPRARATALWMHDIHAGDDFDGDLLDYGAILCLSRWAKSYLLHLYPAVPKERFVLTRNGIDADLFRSIEPKKEGFRCIYSSSPDRGLDRLLDFWPEIRKIREDAELHVYYGFGNWRKMAKSSDERLKIDWYEEWLRRMEKEGVVYHGRVGQRELAEAFAASSLWPYPTNFHETSCITAMEAQVSGCVPVTSKLAALAETVRYGCLVDPPNFEDRYREEFLRGVRGTADGVFREAMEQARPWALAELGWEGVARRWAELFEVKIAESMGTR